MHVISLVSISAVYFSSDMAATLHKKTKAAHSPSFMHWSTSAVRGHCSVSVSAAGDGKPCVTPGALLATTLPLHQQDRDPSLRRVSRNHLNTLY